MISYSYGERNFYEISVSVFIFDEINVSVYIFREIKMSVYFLWD